MSGNSRVTSVQPAGHVPSPSVQEVQAPPPRRRSRRRTVMLALLAVLGAGIGGASTLPSVGTPHESDAPSQPGVSQGAAVTQGSNVPERSNTPVEGAARELVVETTVATPVTSIETFREYTGTIVARRTSDLSFELAGLVRSLHVDEGDAVSAGQSLAVLDTESLVTRRRETLARRDQAAAQLAEMIAGPRREDIDAARASIAALEPQVELLQRQTDRVLRVLRQNAIAQDEADQFVFGLKARKAQLQRARHELEELLNGTRQEQIDAQQALVAQLNAASDGIDVQIRKSELRAPFSGTVSRRLVDEGAVVQPGQSVLTLVEDAALEAWVGLPIETANTLAIDSRHHVRIDDRLYESRVSSRRPEVDLTTRTRTVILQLEPAAADSVVQGQVARLQLTETVAASGFWLPLTSLTEGDRGLWTCLVAVPQSGLRDDAPDGSPETGTYRVERRDVEVLHTESERVLVRGTLDTGDHVIACGTHRVSPGQSVTLARSATAGSDR